MERKGFSERIEERSDNPNTQKGGQSDVRNYTGVTFLCTMYKICPAILGETLKEH